MLRGNEMNKQYSSVGLSGIATGSVRALMDVNAGMKVEGTSVNVPDEDTKAQLLRRYQSRLGNMFCKIRTVSLRVLVSHSCSTPRGYH